MFHFIKVIKTESRLIQSITEREPSAMQFLESILRIFDNYNKGIVTKTNLQIHELRLINDLQTVELNISSQTAWASQQAFNSRQKGLPLPQEPLFTYEMQNVIIQKMKRKSINAKKKYLNNLLIAGNLSARTV